jgi:nucleotide-binding universal stress UspA family protein
MQTREKRTRRARLEKILVPVDFSPAAREAVRYASDLAEQHRSKIVLLHVVPSSEPNDAPEAAKRELARLRKSERVPPARCSLMVRAGVPFFEITQSADENGVDLIVVGRRQQLSADSLGDGHTSERIARYATCPVLLVRESGDPT